MNRLIPFLLFILILITSCKNNEIGEGKDVNPESIYFDYQVFGEEGKDNMTVLLQYRFAGPNGTTLVMDDPAKVEFDGKLLTVDSSKLGGAYYEDWVPLNKFTGSHNIVFTDLDQKQYKETFNFQPVTLKTEIPAKVHRRDLVFDLNGLDTLDEVRIILTDTSFNSPDINRVDTVKNGKITISKKDLEKVVNGPVYMELIKEAERPVKNGTNEGGTLSVSYALKRDFTLED